MRAQLLCLLFFGATVGCGRSSIYDSPVVGPEAPDAATAPDLATPDHCDADILCWDPPVLIGARKLWASSGRDVWAIGDAGIAHWDGVAWSKITAPTMEPLGDIWGSSATDIWIVGGNPVVGDQVILHFDGSHWTTLPMAPIGGPLVGVSGTSQHDVWAVGSSSTLLHFDGNTWARAMPYRIKYHEILAVWAATPTTAWANYAGDGVLQWNGLTWNDQVSAAPAGTFVNVRSIWGAGVDDVWAVGGHEVWRRQGGAWNRVAFPFPADPSVRIAQLRGTSAEDVWLVGAGDHGGFTWHFDGAQFRQVQIGTPGELRAVFPISAVDVWIAGSDGLVHGHRP